jgi:CheY-like chemotaxis protein
MTGEPRQHDNVFIFGIFRPFPWFQLHFWRSSMKSRCKCTNIILMRLLLVEDEIDIQSFLQRSLEEAGYQVEAAADGKTAERLAMEGPFDILIVDLGLPDQDGITLILKLRQLGVSAPVLILSARRSVDDRVRGLEQGGDDYLTKALRACGAAGPAAQPAQTQQSTATSEATRLRCSRS